MDEDRAGALSLNIKCFMRSHARTASVWPTWVSNALASSPSSASSPEELEVVPLFSSNHKPMLNHLASSDWTEISRPSVPSIASSSEMQQEEDRGTPTMSAGDNGQASPHAHTASPGCPCAKLPSRFQRLVNLAATASASPCAFSCVRAYLDGHDRFQALAFRLKDALQRRGHAVWVDTEQLAAGVDWEDGIARALAWVRDAQQDGRVLMVMTPHALRRPDGYCLNEIARAAAMRLSIFPVLVADSTPPPSAALLPFFDLRDCVPSGEDLMLAADSPEWHEKMTKYLDSPRFLGKADRLYAVLELFDSMTSYGVPAVARLENLGLFPGYDSAHPADTPRSNRVRRLLSPSRPLTSLSSSNSQTFTFDTPRAQGGITPRVRQLKLEFADSSTASGDSDIVSGPSSPVDSPPASPFNLRDHRTVSACSSDTDDAGAIEEAAMAARDTRYVLSFDDSCRVLAQQLYDDLNAAGFSVYPLRFPSSGRILSTFQVSEDLGNSGDLGASAHEDALRWAAAEKKGKLILLLTSESVGRPRGVSLNDVSAAMTAGLGFIPLLVRPCEIPLSICRIQWLDMTDCLLYTEPHGGVDTTNVRLNTVRYKSRKQQLIAALEGGTLDHEGQQARLFSLLTPFSFVRQISQLTARFVGRKWLFQRFQQWLEASPAEARVFWVSGQIGSGKTAVAARMVQTCPEIAAFHFARQDDEQTRSSRRCVLSLAYQLTTQLPEYALFLQSHEPLEEIVPVASFPVLVRQLLLGPLNAIAQPANGKPVVLLIDGLEWLLPSTAASSVFAGPPGSQRTEERLVALLPAMLTQLPSWVRVVLLSRDEPAVLSELQAFAPPNIAFDHFQHENEQDLRQYLRVALSELPLNGIVDGSESADDQDAKLDPLSAGDENDDETLDLERAVELIARRAEGVFTYAVNVVQAIAEGRLHANDLATLPIGMRSCVQQLFTSHFADAELYRTRVRPVLEVLCAAYEPLPLSTLTRVLDGDAYERRDVGTMLGSLFFVEPQSQLLRPFHSSVLDWLQDSTSAGSFFVDVASGHERLGRWAAREYQRVVRAKKKGFVNLKFDLERADTDTHQARVYIVRHACNHLMQARAEDCMQLLAAFAADENFQLARRLLQLRAEGLESFFHGDISREEAQRLLAQRSRVRVGSFLIRYTARQQAYCASFVAALDPRTGAPSFRHNLIYHLSSGAYSAVPPADVTTSTVVFPDLVSFVEQYQRKGILTTPVAREVPLNRQISGPNADT